MQSAGATECWLRKRPAETASHLHSGTRDELESARGLCELERRAPAELIHRAHEHVLDAVLPAAPRALEPLQHVRQEAARRLLEFGRCVQVGLELVPLRQVHPRRQRTQQKNCVQRCSQWLLEITGVSQASISNYGINVLKH